MYETNAYGNGSMQLARLSLHFAVFLLVFNRRYTVKDICSESCQVETGRFVCQQSFLGKKLQLLLLQ